MRRSFVKLSVLCTVILLFVSFFPPKALYSVKASGTHAEISLDAKGAILIEPLTGRVLYEKNCRERLYPASTTKILTALIALEKGNLEDILTLGKEVNMVPWDSSKAHLKEGEQITLRELIMGLMLPSGNDAAAAIGVYIGRIASNDNSLEEAKALDKFVEIMNERAKKAGATGSNFMNPHGYHDDNHYTTAHDLALIAREAMKNEFFREVVKTLRYDAEDMYVFNNGQVKGSIDHAWRNTNALINQSNKNYYEYATGIKTGFTTPAGYCLVSSASKDGLELISVVLCSSNKRRWEDPKALFEYGFDNYSCYKAAVKDQPLSTLKVANSSPGSPEYLTGVPEEDFAYVYNKSDVLKIERSIIWDKNLIGPIDGEYNRVNLMSSIETGQVIGKMVFILNGTVLKVIDLKALESIEKQNTLHASTGALAAGNINRSSLPGAGVIYGAAGTIILLTRAASRKRRVGM